MRTVHANLCVLVALTMGAAACGDATGGSPGTTSTTFEGIIAGDSASGLLSGKISLTIETASLGVGSPTLVYERTGAAASVNVTGTLTLVGGTIINLTGSYDTGAHTLSIAGGGYTFTGTFSGGVLSGTFTTPGGGTGSFSTATPTGGGAVYSFCGTAVSTTKAGAGATFNVVFNTGAASITGIAYGNHDKIPTQLAGTLSSNNWSLSFTNGQGHPGSASGTFTSTSITGTYNISAEGEAGNVTASICH